MNQHHVAIVSRALTSLPSRRDILRGLAGAGFGFGALWLPDIAETKNKRSNKKQDKNKKRQDKDRNQNQNQNQIPPVDTLPPPPVADPPLPPSTCMPNCVDRTCGSDGCGGSCGNCSGNKTCQGGSCVCVPESPDATCAGRCGVWTNTCGQPVACATCTGDRVCLSNGSCAEVCVFGSCPSGCECGFAEGSPRTCYTLVGSCMQIPRVCTSTAECPRGQFCQGSSCGPGGSQQNRCWPICTA